MPPWSVEGSSASLDLAWDQSHLSAFELRVSVTLATEVPAVSMGASSQDPAGGAKRTVVPLSDGLLERIAAGAANYTGGCTALAVDGSQRCIITDHRLLPLSWTRDAYYQAAMLLSCAQTDAWSVEVVQRHLAWLWGPGRDSDGVWQRSHFATGGVKDSAYQADQQLYPLLELADYRRVTGRWPRPPGSADDPAADEPAGDEAFRWGDLVRRVWTTLPRGLGGLIPGDENPADDAAEFPYLLSSQLLLAYTATRVAEFDDELAVQDLGLGADAEQTLASLREAFACDGPFGPQWAYESDGGGGRRLYHDANDVPTAVAPLWGLCAADDPRWQSTMRFAWSSHNPGFVSGKYGGLGSAHTPGVWPLGDAQQWTVAMTTGDHTTAERVLDKLRLVTSEDGMLPETYDPETGDWMARHWFAWPGSLVGLLHRTINDRTGPWMVPTP